MPPARPTDPIQAAAQHLRANQAEAALAALGRMSGAQADYIRGMALGRLGRLTEADTAFARAAEPPSPVPLGELRLNQGHAHRRAGRPKDALAFYDEAAALGAPGAQGARGAALRALGRLEAARDAYERQRAATPNDPSVLTNLGGVLNALGETDEARRVLDSALRLRPGSAVALNNRAAVARAVGDHEELDLLRRAARAAPNDPDILANLGRAAALYGEAELAIESFAAAIRRAPARRDVHRDLNRFAWEVDRDDLFLASYRVAIASVTANEAALLALDAGRLAASAGRQGDAAAWFERSLAAAPTVEAAIGLVGVTPPDEAESRWQEMLRRTGDGTAGNSAAVRLGAARFYLSNGAAERAEPLLEAAVPPRSEPLRLAYDSIVARLLGRERYATRYDPNRLVRDYELPVPPRYASRTSFLDAVTEALEARLVTRNAPVDQSLFGGAQVGGELWATRSPALQDLRAAMMGAARAYWNDLDGLEGRQGRSGAEVSEAGAWAVRLTSGGGHKDHIHPDGDLSSVHYVRVPEELPGAAAGTRAGKAERGGWLRLGRPGIEGVDLPAALHIRPEPGLMVLFPSFVWHGVEPFVAPTPRWTTPADFRIGPATRR